MAELAIRHVEHSSIIDLRPAGVAGQKHKLRLRIDKIFDQPRAGHAVDLNFLASDPFHELSFLRGSVVLVCSCSSSPLWSAPNFYPPRRRTNKRRTRRLRRRSQRGIVDLALSRVSLAKRALEPKIQHAWFQLLGGHRNLRRRGHDRVFPPLSNRRTTLFRSRDSRGRRRHHGDRRDFVFPRTGFMATPARRNPGNRRTLLVAPLIERDRCTSRIRQTHDASKSVSVLVMSYVAIIPVVIAGRILGLIYKAISH